MVTHRGNKSYRVMDFNTSPYTVRKCWLSDLKLQVLFLRICMISQIFCFLILFYFANITIGTIKMENVVLDPSILDQSSTIHKPITIINFILLFVTSMSSTFWKGIGEFPQCKKKNSCNIEFYR